MSRLSVELPDSIPAAEARFEMAAGLYQAGRVTQGQAARLADLSRRAFIELLGKRGIPFTNIDVEDLEVELSQFRSDSSHD